LIQEFLGDERKYLI